LSFGGGDEKVPEVIHGHGYTVHFVQSVLFAAFHKGVLCPAFARLNHPSWFDVDGKWCKPGNPTGPLGSMA
jgi:hypothetical protein